ncbi:hypothetical protein BKA67DRAFT_590781 [Truncatella angustata]|uniref:RING-type E3 ubiquitin transferase n=1 Tax=Truncatella angustata TaxID=152316 RepID=A0A9P8US77_9PEZI|nr:uncharacterized protein BKA67DRAFT_590781 [Truncatella angustata]KAH6657075.1 hypothetical protein BKA67DRAFT_590781 [Truncatella angustata]
MRPPRIAILSLFFAACLFLLCRSIASAARTSPAISAPASSTQRSGFRTLFSWTAPFSLFSPNAIISIAEDNSTSFAARPAAFGPLLPNKGLNGQLWIGSGFTEETLQDDEDSDGELGCSDVPGWDGSSLTVIKTAAKKLDDKSKSTSTNSGSKRQKREQGSKTPMGDRPSHSNTDSKAKNKHTDDGTDDYLHEGLDLTSKSQNDAFGLSSSGHADIQSIQESAEIAGKIVLLSRGGCGFLEKVKWAQRRGAIALIVGDKVRGGPLIQMYARGDTSNITIPSIFTSRTTAYLLSSLMQPGSFIEDIIDENGKPSYQVQRSDKARRARLHTTTTAQNPQTTDASKGKASATKKAVNTKATDKIKPETPASGWFTRIFKWGSGARSTSRSRPPSSGQHDWVLVEEFSDSQDKLIKNNLDKTARKTGQHAGSKSDKLSGDEFQIGVEDWRDPDLVGSSVQKDNQKGTSKDGKNVPEAGLNTDAGKTDAKTKDTNKPKGGSITPGSGEYSPKSPKGKPSELKAEKPKPQPAEYAGLLSKLFGGHHNSQAAAAKPLPPPRIETPIVEKPAPGELNPPEQEGLWVVITPTSGASPFFDTLLVLVVSPLITLTVVYALLILRARIRRRRWRAPKSVVERLPVRTFHTVASTPSQSPRVTRPPSPAPPSPTTPLLQSQHNASRPRPRSRTTTGVASDLLQVNSSLQVPRSPPQEKPSEWKKYMGRQVECVVCLEEYVDGVSQVMSLPCGHEFHVECITPWLTTRRRTCPICKGDVVRSLARGSPSSPRYEPYRDDSDDGFGAEASTSSSLASRGPIHQQDHDSDVEQGVLSPTGHTPQQENWFSTLSRGLREATSSANSRPRDTAEDRDR